MPGKISLKLYIPGKRLNEYIDSVELRYIYRYMIDGLWVEIANRNDFEKVETLSKELGKSCTVVVKEGSLIPAVLESDVSSVVISPSLAGSLAKYKRQIRKKDKVVYISITGCRDFSVSAMIRELSNALELLSYEGLHYTHVYISHLEPKSALFLHEQIAEQVGNRQAASFFPYQNEHERMLLNSLVLGKLVYEGMVRTIVSDVPSDCQYTPSQITDDIKLIKRVLGSFNLAVNNYSIISCPQCGRSQVNLIELYRKVEMLLNELDVEYRNRGKELESLGGITVAVMGCNVNGPSEARSADIGIAGGKNGRGTIFKNGEVVATFAENCLIGEFNKYLRKMVDERFRAVIEHNR